MTGYIYVCHHRAGDEGGGMKFISLFAGIGGFDLGLERASMLCIAQVEIDKAAQGILHRHFPKVKLFEDVKTYSPNGTVDLICGGFPCQDVSIAGHRAGLAGERSGLWYEFHRIIECTRPGWVIIENVPGLLSSNEGRDFAAIVHGLAECGYGVAWRILDAQYFGVAQRRRRVFIVGHLGDGRAAQVLFERESLSGDTPPRRETGESVAHAISASPTATGRLDPTSQDFIAFDANRDGLTYDETVSPPLKHGGDGEQAHSAYAKLSIAYNIQHNDGGDHRRKDRPDGGMYVNETDTALTVGTADMTAIAFAHTSTNDNADEISPPITLSSGLEIPSPPMVYQPLMGVRRLTPTECERLQGFPDGWTDGQADSTRYRQLGNAVAVPVIEWIGKRIIQVTG